MYLGGLVDRLVGLLGWKDLCELGVFWWIELLKGRY